ncbi:MAG: DUF3160 domain-containing protein [Deltaproteobacteria bacterium]|nr:DUF3160 domain-containing protein [Deltaproteobacteria bacterium]
MNRRGRFLIVGLAGAAAAAIVVAWSLAGGAAAETPTQARDRRERKIEELQERAQELLRDPKRQQEAYALFEEAARLLEQPTEGEPALTLKAIPQGDVFGFQAAFDKALKARTGATSAMLAARAPAFATAAPKVQGAKYLDRMLTPKTHDHPNPARALDAAERAVLDQQGFVVSARLGAASAAGLMHTIYEHDQPLFVSADAVLHAWHMSYDAMLEELESTWLLGALEQLLAEMAGAIPIVAKESRSSALGQGVKDADLYLAVGRSLLADKPVKPMLGGASEVEELVRAIQDEQVKKVQLFGRTRTEDFSQMRPRGHYDKSEALRRYFRAMMWLGRTELKVAGPDSAPAELAAAVVLHDLLTTSKQLDAWRQIDRVLQTFVGRSDSMGPPDISALLTLGRFSSARAVATDADLEVLRRLVLDTRMGAQQVNAQIALSDPERAERVELPRAFCLLGQRFTIDSWVTGQVVYDRILVDGRKVERVLPSGVDIAFAALANDNVADLLASRIERGPLGGRDRLPFQANLLAARDAVDARSVHAWDGNLYDLWLSALRGLSAPTTSPEFPAVMRTRAWSRRVLQAQLASWAELRHDTILYVKQSYGMGITCEHPSGFVELAPQFWARMEAGASLATTLLGKTPYPPALAGTKERQVTFARSFAATMGTLRGIVERERTSQPLDAAQEAFLKDAVEITHGGMCGAPPRWDGWYLDLYYRGQADALKTDALVADVYTHPQAGILHAATGPFSLMVVVIDRGGDRMAFAGPVSSYYEWVPAGGKRLTDHEWKVQLSEGKAPAPPEWIEGWQVGKPVQIRADE